MHPLKIKVIKIDEFICKQLQTKYDMQIHSVFLNSVNLLMDETLITIGSAISMNKHHVLTEEVHFGENNITSASIIKPCNSGFMIDDLFFSVSREAVVCCNPVKTTAILRNEHLIKAKKLLEWLGQQPNTSILNYDKCDFILNYQFIHLYNFIEKESFDTALQIVGLGVGLTPLGDDFLLGYILAKESLGIELAWLPQILTIAKKRTNMISYQSYKDVLDGYYSEQFVDMVNEFYEEKTFNHAKLILNYGATSGAGILTGFIFGLLPKGEVRNECLESIKKHLL